MHATAAVRIPRDVPTAATHAMNRVAGNVATTARDVPATAGDMTPLDATAGTGALCLAAALGVNQQQRCRHNGNSSFLYASKSADC
jgi:hypothetical protein